jgi:Domain of unknown function (DUF4471)
MKKGKEKGLKKEVRGLWTDIVSSPYYSFGVDCETPNAFAEGLFEIFNKVRTREDITLRGHQYFDLISPALHKYNLLFKSEKYWIHSFKSAILNRSK